MMSRQLENALIEALDLLEQGVPVETILARYPDLAVELRPFLQTAADLGHVATPAPMVAQQASKRAFLQQTTELQQARRPMSTFWLRRVFAAGLAMVLVFVVGGSLLAYKSTQALPGDTMYGAKLFLEAVRLDVTNNPETAVRLNERFRQQRVAEVAALIAKGRREQVTLAGLVDEMSPDGWVVAGIPVVITPETIVNGEVKVGFEVEVSGTTADGALQADHVEVVVGLLPETKPPEPVPQPPVATPIATWTPEPAVSPTLTPTRQETLEPPAAIPNTAVPVEEQDDGESATPIISDGQPGDQDVVGPTPTASSPEDGSPSTDDSSGDSQSTPESDHEAESTPEAGHD